MKNTILSIPMWMDVLISIMNGQKYCYGIVRKRKLTYSHVNYLLYKLEYNDLITRKKKGRKQIITITKKGKVIALLCNDLKVKCSAK